MLHKNTLDTCFVLEHVKGAVGARVGNGAVGMFVNTGTPVVLRIVTAGVEATVGVCVSGNIAWVAKGVGPWVDGRLGSLVCTRVGLDVAPDGALVDGAGADVDGACVGWGTSVPPAGDT